MILYVYHFANAFLDVLGFGDLRLLRSPPKPRAALRRRVPRRSRSDKNSGAKRTLRELKRAFRGP